MESLFKQLAINVRYKVKLTYTIEHTENKLYIDSKKEIQFCTHIDSSMKVQSKSYLHMMFLEIDIFVK